MSERQVEVRTGLGDGQELVAGTLYFQGNTSTFLYADEYIRDPRAFELTPFLPFATRSFSFDKLGQFSDAAPDRWGRRIIDRNRKGRNLPESEYLLGVNDVTRQGALRFFSDGKPLAGNEGVPVQANLPDLLDTADAVQNNQDVDDASLRRLYQATGSLGGARPKASVSDRNALWMAKFPKPDCENWDIIGWEAVTLEIAEMAGIDVPEHQVVKIKDAARRQRTVLLTKRFDRAGEGTPEHLVRIPYVSALTALQAVDGEGGDWEDLVEFARAVGADTHELWRRALFGAAIGNRDDHLRNHGFLRVGNGWQLSPAFDLNPEPYYGEDDNLHELSLFGDPHVDIAALVTDKALGLFGVSHPEAKSYESSLRSALKQAIGRARIRGLDHASIKAMETRFAWALEQLGD
ncbi:type II toxin-antitoxin system HipA family toxin [Bifidobacterium sp. ESL0690]|uniref:type II toxin-antitoxin system HipA family toxin n=1 Tax=Bifidobacterium sp. ESL0690 TaxID=2983214 RepID=UPI0023F676D9|nr:type II toxin-antitoxin system HipA family toxin [Bifidobacterium sp. ESL0690]WEV46392.1 type II toxin-antitoxin system HipA family toxin [Bifidobacterium sp. ESL0690]